MPLLLLKRAPKVAIAFSSYKVSRYLRLPNDASKMVSMAVFTHLADELDLEFMTPLILTPIIQSRIRSPMMSKSLYSLSMAYITWQWCFAHHHIPESLRRFLDRNCGLTSDNLSHFRFECDLKGWPCTKLTDSVNQKQILLRCASKLAVGIGKLEVLSILAKTFLFKKQVIDIRFHLESWIRTMVFCFIIMQMCVHAPIHYNRIINPQSSNKEEGEEKEGHMDHEKDPKNAKNPIPPNKLILFSWFTLSSFIGIHVQSKSKRDLLASCLFLQAVITNLKKHNIRMKSIAPFLCYLFANTVR